MEIFELFSHIGKRLLMISEQYLERDGIELIDFGLSPDLSILLLTSFVKNILTSVLMLILILPHGKRMELLIIMLQMLGIIMIVNSTQAAKALGVSPRRVLAIIKSGRLPAVKVGRDWIILKSDLKLVSSRKPGRPKKAA